MLEEPQEALSVDEDGPAREAAEQQDEDASLQYDPHSLQVPAAKGLGKINPVMEKAPHTGPRCARARARPPAGLRALPALAPALAPQLGALGTGQQSPQLERGEKKGARVRSSQTPSAKASGTPAACQSCVRLRTKPAGNWAGGSPGLVPLTF